MIMCPFCGFEVAADDIKAQGAHLEAKHPNVIPDRLRAAGFEQRPDGTWVDTLVTGPTQPLESGWGGI